MVSSSVGCVHGKEKTMAIFNEKMAGLGKKRSAIRDIFEYATARRAEIGNENVFDFSLGNPSVPAPQKVDKTIARLTEECPSVALHGYTSATGDASLREDIASSINSRFKTNVDKDCIYMTCGAAASLTITLNALCVKGDNVVAIAPYFPEYKVFAEAAGAEFKVVPADTTAFQIDFDALEKTIDENTKAVIINSPNNPTGVVITPENIKRLCAILEMKSAEKGEPIYLISDEPYRELVYDDSIEVPYLMNEYKNTIVCYSFSKSLSLPGERIGYIAVSPEAEASRDIYAAICGAGRALGYVCAPSMMQKVVKECLGMTSDISVYKTNRDLLYTALSDMGFECVHPDGAFYLFVKSPEDEASVFAERAKKHELLLVPSDSFGTDGYVRISYCVSTDMIKRSLAAFKALAEEYGLGK